MQFLIVKFVCCVEPSAALMPYWKLEPPVPQSIVKPWQSTSTLSAVIVKQCVLEFIDYVDNFNVKKIKFSVSEFYLKKSDLQISGPVYTTIEEFKLKNN